MSYTDDEKQLISGLLEKLNDGDAPDQAYIFNKDEVALIKEMMMSYRDVRGVVKIGTRAGKLVVFCAAVYGGWIALKNGVIK